MTISRKILPRLFRTGPFVILCKIGMLEIDKTLYDLGESMNMIPLSVCKELGYFTIEQTSITIQFADKSTKKPEGVLHNVLVQIRHIIVHINFMVVDVEEDKEMPIIIGRPLLDTTNASLKIRG